VSRVLLHSQVFAPDGVSTAYLMTDLARELKRIGHHVTVLTTTPHYNVDAPAAARQPLHRRALGIWWVSELDGVRVWHVKQWPKGNRVWARAFDFIAFHLVSLFLGYFVIGRQDIVITTSPPLTIGVVSWLLGVRWGAPSVYKVAELYPDMAIRQGALRGAFMIGLFKRIEQLVYRRNAMIVPIAETFTRLIRQRNVPDAKLRTIPDCVDLDVYRPLPRQNAFAVEHRLLDEFVVLYGGNIGFFQDWESVVHAAQQVADLPIRFVIVGDGGRRDWLAGEVARLGLTNVTLVGYQPKERMPEINAACDLALVPLTISGAKEGFPSKVYSNLASARPVLVSAEDGSEMAALVLHHKCGRTTPPENGAALAAAIRKAYEERACLPEEGRRGRALIEREYSKEAIARRYDALIQELIAAP
jgi:putative colanic acid biosynthesis glycosyltransferase WcaI